MRKLIFGVHPVKYPAKGKNGKTVDLALVAIWNEYGTVISPPRSAFRMGLERAIEKHKNDIQAQLQNIARRVLQKRNAEIDQSLKVLLNKIGKTAKKETIEIIKIGSTTPNAHSTVARKGFNHPLYEKGLLMKNVDYEVIE